MLTSSRNVTGIPDIQCERCTLQLITYMTDGMHGVAKGDMCVSPQASVEGTADSTLQDCGVIYHSCTCFFRTSMRAKEHACVIYHSCTYEYEYKFAYERASMLTTVTYNSDDGMHTHTHTHARARARTRAHAHTHTR